MGTPAKLAARNNKAGGQVGSRREVSRTITTCINSVWKIRGFCATIVIDEAHFHRRSHLLHDCFILTNRKEDKILPTVVLKQKNRRLPSANSTLLPSHISDSVKGKRNFLSDTPAVTSLTSTSCTHLRPLEWLKGADMSDSAENIMLTLLNNANILLYHPSFSTFIFCKCSA